MHKNDKRMVPVDDNTVIWRYMTFTSFYQFLLTKSLFFARLDRYTDNLEGTLPDATKEELYRYRLGLPYTSETEATEWLETQLENIADYKAYTLSNSWTMNKEESYAMWKIYLSGQKEGLAIKTTVGTLKECLDAQADFEVYSGKVLYEPFSHGDVDVFKVACNKRPAYGYEQEYRAIIFHQFNVGEKNARRPKFDIGTDVNIDPIKMIENIYISPFCSSFFDAVLRSALNNLLPGFEQSKIKRSGIEDS